MNANEVISNRAIELLGGDRFGAEKPIHPNDHVNMGQSTNDMFPTAIHVAVGAGIRKDLIPALVRLAERWPKRPTEWDKIIKIGRTHLADATPLRLGQEIGGFARQFELSVGRAGRAARGRAANCRPAERPSARASTRIRSSAAAWPRVLAKETGVPFVEAVNHFEANAQRDGLVECHGQLRTIATTLFNVANNIRWLGSGPRCGFYEVKLPDRQPGSSIMPGKVNPVMCESMMQVCALRAGQRSDDHAQRRGRRAVPAQHHDARSWGNATLESVRAAGQRARGPSSISAPPRWRPTPKPARPRSKRACRW